MKKYRIISRYKTDGTLLFFPQIRKWFIWKNFIIVRNNNTIPMSFIKLCDAYTFIDDYIKQNKIETDYGIKVHQYPGKVEE